MNTKDCEQIANTSILELAKQDGFYRTSLEVIFTNIVDAKFSVKGWAIFAVSMVLLPVVPFIRAANKRTAAKRYITARKEIMDSRIDNLHH